MAVTPAEPVRVTTMKPDDNSVRLARSSWSLIFLTGNSVRSISQYAELTHAMYHKTLDARRARSE